MQYSYEALYSGKLDKVWFTINDVYGSEMDKIDASYLPTTYLVLSKAILKCK